MSNNLKVDAVTKEIESRIVMKLADVGEMLVNEVKANTPVDTGKLKNSINYDIDSKNQAVIINSNVDYSQYVEVRQPFMKPSIEKNRSKILEQFKDLF